MVPSTNEVVFVTLLFVNSVRLPDLRTAAAKSVLYIECGNGVVGVLPVVSMLKLKACFVNNCLVYDRSFSQLNVLFSAGCIVAREGNAKPPTPVARVVLA